MPTARQQANALVALLRHERDALADFLVALAAFDRERRWVDLGHDSLFAFLVKDLGLSNGAAAYRKAAVELVQRFPRVLEHLRSGELCITTVFELSKVITEENASEVLPRFFGASKRDARNVVAELAPEPAPTRTVVTAVALALPASPPAPSLVFAAAAPAGRLADHVRANSEPATQVGRDSPCTSASPAPTVVEPKNAELSRVHLTVPRRLLEKLAAAKDALSHSHPGASDAEVLEIGLDLAIARHRKRRGIGCKPRKTVEKPQPAESGEASPSRPPPPPERSRHVPADVWRAVWERDGGRCAWPLEVGGVCGSTRRLELDHVDGFALGAGTTVDECRLLCRRHQILSARRLYGDDLMDRYIGPKGGACSEPAASYGPASCSSVSSAALRTSPGHTRSKTPASRAACRRSAVSMRPWTRGRATASPRRAGGARGGGMDGRFLAGAGSPLGLAPDGARPRCQDPGV